MPRRCWEGGRLFCALPSSRTAMPSFGCCTDSTSLTNQYNSDLRPCPIAPLPAAASRRRLPPPATALPPHCCAPPTSDSPARPPCRFGTVHFCHIGHHPNPRAPLVYAKVTMGSVAEAGRVIHELHDVAVPQLSGQPAAARQLCTGVGSARGGKSLSPAAAALSSLRAECCARCGGSGRATLPGRQRQQRSCCTSSSSSSSCGGGGTAAALRQLRRARDWHPSAAAVQRVQGCSVLLHSVPAP